MNPEYVNPNCSLDNAIELVDRLTREFYLNTRKI
nr:MAG TPA: hypothetical protein [Caudoviricetes sp.]